MALSNQEKLFLYVLFEHDLFFRRIGEAHKSLIQRGFIRRLPKAKVRAAGYGYRRVGVVGLELTEAGISIVEAWL